MGILSFFGFGNEPVLPLSGPPSPSRGVPLQEVVVKKNTPPVTTGATAPPLPPNTVGAANLMRGIPPAPMVQTARRGEYVALGGSRKGKGRKGKGRKSKKAKKSKSKKSKASKSRK